MMPEDLLEGLPIGLLILGPQGSLVLSNSCARSICARLPKASEPPLPHFPCPNFLPQPIRRMCQAVIESRDLFPERPVIIEDVVPLDSFTTIQIRARWLELETDSYLLVMLETEPQAQPLSEAPHQLTDREAEVWQLRRAGYPYKAIAAQLQITLNTVKKHIKSIHAKREVAKWLSE